MDDQIQLTRHTQKNCTCVMCSGNQFHPVEITQYRNSLTFRFEIGHRTSSVHYLDRLDGLPRSLYSPVNHKNTFVSYLELSFNYVEGQFHFQLNSMAYSKFHSYDVNDLLAVCAALLPKEVCNSNFDLTEFEEKRRAQHVLYDSVRINTDDQILPFSVDTFSTFFKELAKHTGMRPNNQAWFTEKDLNRLSDAFVEYYKSCLEEPYDKDQTLISM